jgi:chromosome segregation ATPase
VDLWSHEREEYQRAIVELVTSRDITWEHLQTANAELATAKAERDRLTRERDQLWESLKSKTQDANNELAKQQPEPVKWRTLTKNDQYSGPGQVRDDEERTWHDAYIIGLDFPGEFPIVARIGGGCRLGYKFARVREEGGEQ